MLKGSWNARKTERVEEARAATSEKCSSSRGTTFRITETASDRARNTSRKRAKPHQGYGGSSARYEDARRRHEVTVAEHLQAEELLWKEKESLSRDHEQSSRKATHLEEKLKELQMVHASELARSAAEVDIAKQDLTAAKKQCDKLQEAVGTWERKYMGAVDSFGES